MKNLSMIHSLVVLGICLVVGILVFNSFESKPDAEEIKQPRVFIQMGSKWKLEDISRVIIADEKVLVVDSNRISREYTLVK